MSYIKFRNTFKAVSEWLLQKPVEDKMPETSVLLTDTNVGRSLNVPPGTVGTILDLNGPDEDSRIVTVTLVAPRRRFPPILLARSRAFVQWGSAGVQAEARLDFINGTIFSVGCASLRVTAENIAVPFAPGDKTDTFGAFAAYGGNNNIPQNAQLTDYIDAPFPAPNDLPVPTFAKKVLVLRDTNTTTGFRVSVQNAAGVSFYDVDVAAGTQMVPLELSNDAFQINIFSTTFPVEPSSYRVIWFLEL